MSQKPRSQASSGTLLTLISLPIDFHFIRFHDLLDLLADVAYADINASSLEIGSEVSSLVDSIETRLFELP